jgi:hypothetical protein
VIIARCLRDQRECNCRPALRAIEPPLLEALPPVSLLTAIGNSDCRRIAATRTVAYATCIVLTRLPTRLPSRAIALPPSGDALGTPLRKMPPPPGPQRASVETPDHGVTWALRRSALAVSLVERHDGDGVDPDEFEAPALRRSRASPRRGRCRLANSVTRPAWDAPTWGQRNRIGPTSRYPGPARRQTA